MKTLSKIVPFSPGIIALTFSTPTSPSISLCSLLMCKCLFAIIQHCFVISPSGRGLIMYLKRVILSSFKNIKLY